jgi:release factor glutamine methyltransferase
VTRARETRAAAWRRASTRIARLDARRLLEAVCACTHAELIADGDEPLTADESARFETLIKRREAGEPLAYLLGSAFFCDLEFSVSPAVLIPRPDTEVLVEQATARALALPGARVVDLGTGSGIVAIMLALNCPAAKVAAVDVSPEALAVARANAARHGASVRFLEGDWYAPIKGECFDLIVANPPYVAAGDAHLQEDGLPYEPAVALSDGIAGGDGFACIDAIIAGAPLHLARGGWLLIEHGYDQAVKIREKLESAGFREITTWRDAARIERVSGGCLGQER